MPGAGPLPSLMILGAPRAGTTSLAAWLNSHPSVHVPEMKEVNFFNRDRQWRMGPDHYASRFAAAGPGQITVDATPEYLAQENVPGRIAEVVPKAKFVAILREPVARAYSHHCYVTALGWERRSFEEVVRAELAGGAGHLDRLLQRGRYAEHLDRYAEHFDRDAVLPVLFEDLVADADATVARVLEFVGVEPGPPPAGGYRPLNEATGRHFTGLHKRMVTTGAWSQWPKGWAARIDRWNTKAVSFPPVDPALASELRAVMRPDNDRLAALLGRDLPPAWTAA